MYAIRSYYADEPLETVLGRADALLYRAKEEGRNRVLVDVPQVGPERAVNPLRAAGRSAPNR